MENFVLHSVFIIAQTNFFSLQHAHKIWCTYVPYRKDEDSFKCHFEYTINVGVTRMQSFLSKA